MKKFHITIITILFISCHPHLKIHNNRINQKTTTLNQYLMILGTVQDAGSPHIACKKDCCKELFLQPDQNRQVVSLGIVDKELKKKFCNYSATFTAKV